MTVVPHYVDPAVTLYAGDCVEVMAGMADQSVDAVCTDPPYGLEFMGKEWDRPWAVGMSTPGYTDGGRRLDRPAFGDNRNANCKTCGGRQRGERRCECSTPTWDRHPREDMVAFQAWCQTWAAECLRVLKPGGHLLAFGGTRTHHRLACAIEDAGFEIRDTITWLYGQGFAKSLNVGKAIESGTGRPEDIRRLSMGDNYEPSGRGRVNYDHGGGSAMNGSTAGVDLTETARQWQGWGTALKPASEMIVVARKPLSGNVAANVQQWGTGALNIDATRVPAQGRPLIVSKSEASLGIFGDGLNGSSAKGATDLGRWPPNVVLTHSYDCERVGSRVARTDTHYPAARGSGGLGTAGHGGQAGLAEASPGGEVVPVFRCAADCPVAELDRQTGVLQADRHRAGQEYGGANIFNQKTDSAASFTGRADTPGGASRFFPTFRYEAKAPAGERPKGDDGTGHPTVKPLDLMQWLVRLVTPPGGTVLDCFAGSGTTGEAAVVEGFRCILIEKDPTYLPLIVARLSKPIQPDMFGASDDLWES